VLRAWDGSKTALPAVKPASAGEIGDLGPVKASLPPKPALEEPRPVPQKASQQPWFEKAPLHPQAGAPTAAMSAGHWHSRRSMSASVQKRSERLWWSEARLHGMSLAESSRSVMVWTSSSASPSTTWVGRVRAQLSSEFNGAKRGSVLAGEREQRAQCK
jgi:hypothetical protein